MGTIWINRHSYTTKLNFIFFRGLILEGYALKSLLRLKPVLAISCILLVYITACIFANSHNAIDNLAPWHQSCFYSILIVPWLSSVKTLASSP